MDFKIPVQKNERLNDALYKISFYDTSMIRFYVLLFYMSAICTRIECYSVITNLRKG